MAKELMINDNLYNRIKVLASEKNMEIDDFLNYLIERDAVNTENILFEHYSEFKNILIEELGLFDYKGNQCGIYNRLKESGVNTLQDLFQKYSSRKLKYGDNKLGDNKYIHNEMDGIINLLKYEYLNEESIELNEYLNTIINAHYRITVSSYPTGFPGEIFKAVMRNNYPTSIAYNDVNNLFRLFKSCGFNLTCSKALIDYAFYKQIKEEKLGDFLRGVDVNEIKHFFAKVPNDYILFLNIYNILDKYYKNVLSKNMKIK